jgi:hypothetical protein
MGEKEGESLVGDLLVCRYANNWPEEAVNAEKGKVIEKSARPSASAARVYYPLSVLAGVLLDR